MGKGAVVIERTGSGDSSDPGDVDPVLAAMMDRASLRNLALMSIVLLAGLPLQAQVPVRQFDFGTASSPVLEGFKGVHAGTSYTDISGYGWGEHAPLKDSDKKDADDLQRDFCYGYGQNGSQAAHFLVNLPDGRYWAAFFAGDIQYSRTDTPMDILIDGEKVVDAWKVAGWEWRVVEFETKGGRAAFTFQSSATPRGKYSFWLINGLVIYRGGDRNLVTAKAARLASDVQETYLLKKFTEQTPVTETDAAPLTGSDKVRGYVAFARDLVKTVFPTSLPTTKERQEGLRCLCTPGSYVHATFGIVPLKDLGDCVVSVGEMKSEAGTIPATAWTSHFARLSRERVGTNSYMWQPKVLDPASRADIRAGKTRWWWLTLRVPDNQAAGTYAGEVTFAPRNGPKHVFPLSVQVYAFKLRQPPGEVFGMYWGKRYVLYPRTIRKQFADLREHGCNGITLDVGPTGGFDEQGNLKLDFSEMDEVIKMAQEEGLSSPIPWDGASQIPSMLTSTGLDLEKTRKQYKTVVAAILLHGKQAGWPPILFYPLDEPPAEAIMKVLPLIKEVPGALTYCTLNSVPVGLATVHTMDYACWQHQSARADTRQATIQAGKAFWYYSSNYGESAVTARMRSGFLRWRLGATGMYYWHYQAPHGDPYNALDSSATDHCVAYPTPDGVIPSIGWEGEREGIDDYKYTKMLEWLIEKVGADNPKTEKARAILDKLRAEIPPDGKQVLLMPKAFAFESFDSYRADIASQITELLGMPNTGAR